jgi:hypothetical protein
MDVNEWINNSVLECVLPRLHIRDWFMLVHIRQKEKSALEIAAALA